MKQLSTLTMAALCLLAVPLTSTAGDWTNTTLCTGNYATCPEITVTNKSSKLKIRRVRLYCTKSGKTSSITAEGDLKDDDKGTFTVAWDGGQSSKDSACGKVQIAVKVSVKKSGSWNKCDNWKSADQETWYDGNADFSYRLGLTTGNVGCTWVTYY